MKKCQNFLLLVLGCSLSASLWAQVPPRAFNYSAVARDASAQPIAQTALGIQISILQGSVSGDILYSENHVTETDEFGLFNLVIGAGAIQIGDMSSIPWGEGDFYIQVGMDVNGGSNFSLMGTTQLLSVPYALHSMSVPVKVSSTGDTLSIGSNHVIVPGISTANNSVYCSGAPTLVVDVTNPTTGATWMDRNLGASQAATSSTDEHSFGDLYQWGRKSDGHQCRNSGTTINVSSTNQPDNGDFILAASDWRSPQNGNLWQGVNGVNNPCPNGYRLPTEAEMNEERLSWSSNNAAGAFASPLKLPMSGYRLLTDGSLLSVGTNGLYWTSTVSSIDTRYLNLLSISAFMNTSNRANGLSVRCIKD